MKNDLPIPSTGEEIARTLADALALQRQAYFAHPVPTLAERKADLRTLQRFIRENKQALCDAISADYGHRSVHETLLAEIFPAMDGISHVIGSLRKWMRPQRRSVDLRNFIGASNRVIPQPLGVVGIIVPWNFPLHLSLIPLTYVFAAGNRAMVKMSENSRHLAAFLIEKVPAYFPPEKLRFFDETGGVGIEFSKLMNAGQICTTVDHAWIPRAKVDEFVAVAREIVTARYPSIASTDYTSVIDDRSFERLVGALDDAKARGATVIQVIPGEPFDSATRKMSPHIVLDAPDDCMLLQREIFGPILPIRAYDSLETVIQAINAGPRPLAIYPFSNDKRQVQMLLDRVMSGGVSVNEALFHVAQHDLPFGGVGESGMGHYHGREGFDTFSKLRPVFYQARFSALKLIGPPYGKFATTMLGFLTK
jgi:coniferyl-aldehyde dehydrogenase